MRLKQAAGWNQTENEWRNVMRLAPDGCFGIDVDGELAATTTAVCYGSELAWIGMVLTHPNHRGKGLARRLMEHALASLEGRVDWIKLDATDMGRPLYAKLGFEDECPIERWAAQAAPAPAEDLPPAAPDPAADRAVFGADRTALLGILARIESAGAGSAYGMGRPGSNATYFGPCVAHDPEDAARLLGWFLARHPNEPIYWDILPENRHAVTLARAHGFQPLRKLVRMARKGRSAFPHDDEKVFAIAGFQYG